jgi:MinD superfamily P-loop ATPase
LVNIPVIDTEKCTGCGLCVGVCACNALAIENGVVVYIKSVCPTCTRWCTNCEIACPVGAISCPFEIIIED